MALLDAALRAGQGVGPWSRYTPLRRREQSRTGSLSLQGAISMALLNAALRAGLGSGPAEPLHR
jgi:hypothetical protein